MLLVIPVASRLFWYCADTISVGISYLRKIQEIWLRLKRMWRRIIVDISLQQKNEDRPQFRLPPTKKCFYIQEFNKNHAIPLDCKLQKNKNNKNLYEFMKHLSQQIIPIKTKKYCVDKIAQVKLYCPKRNLKNWKPAFYYNNKKKKKLSGTKAFWQGSFKWCAFSAASPKAAQHVQPLVVVHIHTKRVYQGRESSEWRNALCSRKLNQNKNRKAVLLGARQ